MKLNYRDFHIKVAKQVSLSLDDTQRLYQQLPLNKKYQYIGIINQLHQPKMKHFKWSQTQTVVLKLPCRHKQVSVHQS